MPALTLAELERLQPFLELLQDTFVLLDPDGVIRYASSQARQLLGHRALHGDASKLLGSDNFNALCGPILQGGSDGSRWREIQLARRDEAALDLAACSMAVGYPERNKIGVLLVLKDISGEVGLHKKYKTLLQQQREINRQLRTHIAEKLREHEDDIAQFTEILQLAPAIFSSFITEANVAVTTTQALLTEAVSEDLLISGFRAMHTLKGNARSLGLNLIGGRAHAVEDLLERIRDGGRPLRREDVDALSELLQDVKRAIERAWAIRERLGELTAQPVTIGSDPTVFQTLAAVNLSLRQAISDLGETNPIAESLRSAQRTLNELGNTPLQPLFDYLQVTIGQSSQNSGKPAPAVASQGGEHKVPLSVYSALLTALPHLVRNAVIHGIEDTATRQQKGKTPEGHIEVNATVDANSVVITISDDGKGIDVERLHNEAVQRGLSDIPSATDINSLVFLPGLSTATTVSLDAGRGYGTNAAQAAIEGLGGKIQIAKTGTDGTTFVLTIPLI